MHRVTSASRHDVVAGGLHQMRNRNSKNSQHQCERQSQFMHAIVGSHASKTWRSHCGLSRPGQHLHRSFDNGAGERIRTQLVKLAEQWEHVATTYEFVASLERFLLDQQKGTLPNEVGQLPKDEPAS